MNTANAHRLEESPRHAAAAIAARLASAGHRALFAGGCVRDKLLGLEAADYDVATSATPDQIKSLFPKAHGVGESFGVMLVRHGDYMVEVATFRSDGPYDDGRRPSEVHFADARHDALRRDFTINGLFEDPTSGEIIDYVEGQADISARCLRAIGDARARLSEDRLRALRAVRFAARFDLTIAPDTLAAIRACAQDLGAVSRERIGNEVRRMLQHASRARAVELCQELGLSSVMLQESAAVADLTWLRALPEDAAVSTALAAWMLGLGAEGASKHRVTAWRKALLLSNDETEAINQTLALHGRINASWIGGDRAARKRMAAHCAFAGALQLLGAANPTLASEVSQEVERLAVTGLAPTPFVTGDDLARAGMAPGPAFKGMLERLYDSQLNGDLATREQALQAVADLAKNHR